MEVHSSKHFTFSSRTAPFMLHLSPRLSRELSSTEELNVLIGEVVPTSYMPIPPFLNGKLRNGLSFLLLQFSHSYSSCHVSRGRNT